MTDFTEEAGFITRTTTGMFALERDRKVLEEKIATALLAACESGREEERERCIEACDYIVENIRVSYSRKRFTARDMNVSFSDGAKTAKERIIGDLSKWVSQDEAKP